MQDPCGKTEVKNRLDMTLAVDRAVKPQHKTKVKELNTSCVRIKRWKRAFIWLFLNEFCTYLFSNVNDYYGSFFYMKEHFRIRISLFK